MLKKLLIVAALLVALVVFVACGGETTTDPSVETYTVTFENTNLSDKTLTKGESLQRPSDPEKKKSIFGGWYTDSAFTTEAVFPMTVNADIKLYARFYGYDEAFAEARNNTIGDGVDGFEYTYTLDVNAAYNALSLVGNTVGSAKYSKTGEVNFYDEHVNSGVLFVDGSSYKIRRGTTLQTILLDQNGKMMNLSVEQVGADYKYDSSSMAKAVFEYSEEQLKSIEKTDTKNVYKLDTAMNASSAIALVAKYVNHPIVEKLLGELPATAASTDLFVTFENGKIKSYTYDFKANVSGFEFDLRYTMIVTASGEAKTITPKSFNGVSLSPDEIKSVTDEALAVVNAYKNQTSSGYGFVAKTGVDFGATAGEINATFKGTAYRKLYNGAVYFHNDIEIDSDYKNADLYKNQGIADVHIKETKLSNGEVHLIEKKLLIDSTQKVSPFTDSENTSYYLFDIWGNSGSFSFAEKETKNGETVYTFGLTNEGVAALLTWMNASLDLDPLNKASADVAIYGKFDASSILVNTGKVCVTVENGTLKEVAVTVEGDFTTSLAGSADFAAKAKAQLKLDLTLTPKADGNGFEPYDSVKDAK